MDDIKARIEALFEQCWANQPVHAIWQRHRAANSGVVGGSYIERCSCGAWGPAPWHSPERRRPLLRRALRNDGDRP